MEPVRDSDTSGRGGESALSRAAGRFADLCDRIDQLAAYLAAAGLTAMATILVAEVLLRSVMSRSTLVADEIAAYMLAFISFLALGNTLRAGGHLQVELITNHLSIAARRRVELCLLLIGIASVSFFTLWLTNFVMQSFEYRVDSQSQLETPLWIPQAALPVGSFILILALISRLIRVVRREVHS